MPSLLEQLMGQAGRLFDASAPKEQYTQQVLDEDGSHEEADDPYNSAQLVSEAKEFMERCQQNRRSFDRLWFRSILYYLGNQWLSWDSSSNRWKEKKLKKWVPKPVTNRFASSAAAVCAAIQSTKVEPAAWPSTSDQEDIATANVADSIIEVAKTEIRHETLAGDIAKWQTLNADCFVWTYYDKRDTSLGFIVIPAVQCPDCGGAGTPEEFQEACPHCMGMNNPVAIPDTQHESATRLPVGRLKAKALSPLQVYFNMDIVDPLDRKRYAVAISYELSTVKDMFPDVADKIQPDSSSGSYASQYFMDALAYATEESAYTVGGTGRKDKVTLIHYMKMPTNDTPDGQQMTMTLDGTVCEIGPLESFDVSAEGDKTYFMPITQIGYEKVPGRAYSKTPMYDLLSKQDQLNRIESLMELASMKGIHTSWLLPAGSSVTQLSGEPAQHIRYTPTGTGGNKPEPVTVAPFHEAIIELKKAYEADFEELAGTFDALKGNTPKGVSAGYAIQLLTERSYGRFGPAFSSWEQGWISVYSMLLKLFRAYASEPRYRKIKGAAGAWEIQHFSQADLTGSVDLRIEGGSSKPRSMLAQQALMEALFKMGVINPQDPEQRYLIANIFGMGQILGTSADDERSAAGEWDALNKWQPEVDPMTGLPLMDEMHPEMPFPPGGPMVDPIFDNHIVHMTEHRKVTQTDTWKQMEPWKQNFWRMHQLDHMMQIQAAQQMAASNGKPKPEGGGEDDLHAGSKADEMPDKASNVNKGSSAMGSGGKNQHG